MYIDLVSKFFDSDISSDVTEKKRDYAVAVSVMARNADDIGLELSGVLVLLHIPVLYLKSHLHSHC